MPPTTEVPPYPDGAAARDAWIVARRNGIPRDALDPRRAVAWLPEQEPDAAGRLRAGLTLFLANRECPWRCLMCDLWRHALPGRVQPGDVPEQVRQALGESGFDDRRQGWIKLYNAGSFFDAGAIPPEDLGTLAGLVKDFGRVIVENHPRLVDRRILPFRDALEGARLELAMGLETVHPSVLDRLNKGVTLDEFRRAAAFLRQESVDLRVFVLVKPPFLGESDALEWGCRSVEFAFDCGAQVVSLIATRAGNGALEALARRGEFAPPRLETVEAVWQHGRRLGRGRVFLDLWQLEESVADPSAVAAHRPRYEAWNREGMPPADQGRAESVQSGRSAGSAQSCMS